MINMQKKYWFFIGFCILSIVLMCVLKKIHYRHIYFNSDQIQELHYLAKQGNATAMSKLINYYLAYESFEKTINTFRQYKNVSKNFKEGYYHFLGIHANDYKDEMISLSIELANDGYYYAQISLANFYVSGWLVEKDLQKAEYWTKISKCNKKGISIQECEEKLKQ
jgi:hypothetical protein